MNFLKLLRAGHGNYVINAQARDYMRRGSLSSPAIRLLAEADDKQFADQAGCVAKLVEILWRRSASRWIWA